jgi:hypothetical protein
VAYAFVAVTKLQTSTGATCSGSVSSTAANALFCGAASYVGTTTGSNLSVAGGGTWAADAAQIDVSDTSNKFKLLLASCPSATGGSQTVTVSNGVVSGVTAFVYEFSGPAAAPILDTSPPAVAAGTSTTATTGSETNVQADALFFGVMVDASGANPATVTGTSSGWQYPAGGVEKNGSTFQVIGTGYKIAASALTETSAWTINSVRWDAAIACYKAAAAAAQDTPELYGRPYGRQGQSQTHQLLAQ